jgi:hypothetical protein
MPHISLLFVLIVNLIVVLLYLVFGLLVMPFMRKRAQEQRELTRSEVYERYRADQQDQDEEGSAESEGLVAASTEADALVGEAEAELQTAYSDAETDLASEAAENLLAENSLARDEFMTRVLNDQLDIVEEGPSVLQLADAPVTEYSRMRYVMRALVMFLVPVWGPLCFGLSWLLKTLVFRWPVDIADVIFSKARIKPVEEANPDREMNITPLEEAVSVTDDYHLRGLMLNVLSGDMSASLSSISEALGSDDTESAHYAASYLSDAINELRADTQKLYLQILDDYAVSDRIVDLAIEHAQENGRANVEDSDLAYVRRMVLADECSRYLELVENALRQRVFTELETEELVHNMDRVAGIFYKMAPSEMQPEHFEALATWLNEIGDEAGSDNWLDLESRQYPDTLSYYTCRLKVLYTRKDRERFFDVLDELKNSSVAVDRATLDAIRLFEKEVA